jgi:hypothetical protein
MIANVVAKSSPIFLKFLKKCSKISPCPLKKQGICDIFGYPLKISQI